MAMEYHNPELLKVGEVAALLGVGVYTARRLPIRPVRFNAKIVRWRRADVEAFLAASTQQKAA
jgi:predicted DNA-binding transcriptional regulator AlpA